MVRHEQRRPAERNIFLSFDANTKAAVWVAIQRNKAEFEKIGNYR